MPLVWFCLSSLASFYGAIANALGWVVYAWATTIKKVDVMPWDSGIRVVKTIMQTEVGAGTALQQAIDCVKNTYDNCIVFSDMQIGDMVRDTGSLKKVYCFDLSPYKSWISVKGNMVHFAGFDDTMFKLGADLMNPKRLIAEIEKVDLS